MQRFYFMTTIKNEKENFETDRYEIIDFETTYGRYLEQIKHIFSVLHEGICISNAEGIILKVNPMYEKLSGLAPELLLGKNVKILNRGDCVYQKADEDIELSETINGIYKGPVSPLVLSRKKPASSIQTTLGGKANLLHGYPLFNESGEVELVITFIRDISQFALYKEQQMAYHKNLSHNFDFALSDVSIKREFRHEYVFNSPPMHKILKQVKNIANTDVSVLILGETGVGKGEIAHLVHAKSPRANNILFKADCASIPEALIESEFFGYVRGSFSGAEKHGKQGYFEAASSGSIFLDEIGELPLLMQSKLLRVLQDKEILQIGAVEPKKVDVRIIAATNVDLINAVEEGAFRRDLFYRLNVCVLHIPPLRERKEDIVPLAQFFLERYRIKYKKNVHLSRDVEKLLLTHSWPGNIRELNNLIEGLVINCDGKQISVNDIPILLRNNAEEEIFTDFSIREESKKCSLKDIIGDIEQQILQKSLDEHGSFSKVAEIYGLDRTTVARKLKRQE